jgi:hypothetical protein
MDKRFLDAALSHPKGFHFGSRKCDTGFKGFFQKIIMVDFFVVRNQLFCLLRHPGTLLFALLILS